MSHLFYLLSLTARIRLIIDNKKNTKEIVTYETRYSKMV